MPINMSIEYPKLEAENTKLRMINDSLLAENEKLKRLLEDLTPGGSEFVNDPEYCFDFVKKELRSIPLQILPFKQRSDKLKAINDSLLEALKEIVASYKMCVKKSDQSEYVINAEAAIQKAEQ